MKHLDLCDVSVVQALRGLLRGLLGHQGLQGRPPPRSCKSRCGGGGAGDVGDDAMTRSSSFPRPSLWQLALLLLSVAVLVAGTVTPKTSARAANADLGDARVDRSPMTTMENLVRHWAPLVWLSPGERFMPASVNDFLSNVTPLRHSEPSRTNKKRARALRGTTAIPQGPRSASWYLVSNRSVEELLRNQSSFLYGQDPSRTPVPVYALVSVCDTSQAQRKREMERHLFLKKKVQHVDMIQREDDSGVHMHVTYWLFFPFNEGKPVCVLDLGPLGFWPIPLLWNSCLGTWVKFGEHVGDWEHISLLFKGQSHPDAMYVSAHEAGAFYRWVGGKFVLERQEVRHGPELLQQAAFPVTAHLHPQTGRPELFAALGSHGLWTQPGSHRYVRVPRLYDVSGYGAAWRTWERLSVLHDGVSPRGRGTSQAWLRFLGKWGNPRAGCHPLSSAICQQSDGPTGIPTKSGPFQCPSRRKS